MKRPALQNKGVGILQMVFLAWKVWLSQHVSLCSKLHTSQFKFDLATLNDMQNLHNTYTTAT